MAAIPLHGFGDNTFEYISQPDHTAISALMSMVSLICGNGGAVSLGGDPGSTIIEAAIVYKGNTFTGSITKESIYHNPNDVLNSCCEILERVLKAKPQEPKAEMNGAMFDGEKFIPLKTCYASLKDVPFGEHVEWNEEKQCYQTYKDYVPF